MTEDILSSSGLLIGPDLLKASSILFGPSDILDGDSEDNIELPLWPASTLYPSKNLFPSGATNLTTLYPESNLYLTMSTYPS